MRRPEVMKMIASCVCNLSDVQRFYRAVAFGTTARVFGRPLMHAFLIGLISWVMAGNGLAGILVPPPEPLPQNHTVVLWQDFETPFTSSNTPAGGFPSTGWSRQVMSNNTQWVWATNGINGNPRRARTNAWVNATLGTSNRFAFFGAGSYGNVTRLFTPVLDMTKFKAPPTLSFWHFQAAWPNDQDYLRVQVATNFSWAIATNRVGSGYQENAVAPGWQKLTSYYWNVSNWTERVISLTNLVMTTNTVIMFEGFGEYAYGVCIDDLMVYGSTAAPPVSTSVLITNLWQDFETPWTPGSTNEASPGNPTNMVPRGGDPATGWTKAIIWKDLNWLQVTNGISGKPMRARTNAWVNPMTLSSNRFARFGTNSYENVTRLFTPPLDLTGVTGAVVRFWHCQHPWPSDQDFLRVRITTNFTWATARSTTSYGTASHYQEISIPGWTTLVYYTTQQTTWVERVLPLPQNLGTNTVIAFEGFGEYAYGVCIDDVQITSWSNTAAPLRLRTVTNLWQDFEVAWTPSNTPSGGFPATGWSKSIMSNNTDWVQATNGINGNPVRARTNAWLNPITGTTNKFARFGAGSYGNVTRLFTPPLDLSQSHTVTMSFWHIQVPWPTDQDYLRVRVHTNFTWNAATNRANAEALGWQTLAYYNAGVTSWTHRVFTLAPSNRSANTVFMLEGIGEYSYGTCVDDLQVVSTVVDDTPEGTEGRIALSPSSLAFSGTYGGSNPSGQALSVSNSGIHAFAWTGEASANWLSGSPGSGTVQPSEAGQTTLSVNLAGLSAGEHTTFFTMQATGASNSPQLISATVTVAKASQAISFPAIPPQHVSATSSVSATATSGLPVSFEVVGGPGSLGSGTDGTYVTYGGPGLVTLRASQAGDANRFAAPTMTNTVRVWQVSPNRGPVGGGGAVIITCGALGSGADITSVTVGGASAPITGQRADSVSVTAPAGTGTVAIVVTSTSQGATTLSNAYTYNAQGAISGGTGGTTRKWQSVGQANVPGQPTAVGAQNTIYGVDYYNNKLYASGSFTNIGGTNCSRVAQYDGTNWISMGTGVRHFANVNHLKGGPYGVYAGGYFTNIGSITTLAVGRWDGTNWNAMGRTPANGDTNKVGLNFSPNVNGYVNCIEPYTGNTLIAGGYFTNTDYRTTGLHFIAKYDGVGWTSMQEGFRNTVNCMAYDRYSNHLYVGGGFTNHYPTSTSRRMNFIARWTGTHWTNMGQGFGSRVTCMAVHPTSHELYIGGWFTNYTDSAGNKYPAKYVAKWNPVTQSFTNMGSGFNNWVIALKFDANGSLCAGGTFTNTWITTDPGTVSVPLLGTRRIARWTGTHWTNIGDGVSDTIQSLAVNTNNNDLYAAGFFKLAYNEDGSSTNAWYIAKWAEASGTTPAVEPSSGSVTGGYPVVIRGSQLTDPSDPSDLTAVTLCGVNAASIVSATPTQIVVMAGMFISGDRTGDVRVVSTAHGTAVASNAFVYTGVLSSILQVKGINNDVIASGETPSAAKGTRFPKRRPNEAVTNLFNLYNPGGAAVTISGYGKSGAGAGAFTVNLPIGTLAAGATTNLSVAFNPLIPGEYSAGLLITNSASGVYTGLLAGGCWAISTNAGPYAGGNPVTVTNGFFGTITNVLVGATQVSPLQTGTSGFTLTMPAATNAGLTDIIVQTSDNGATTLADAYTYRPAGTLSSVTPATGSVTGGYPVVIAGANLTDLSDLTDLTLCGVTATVQSASATQIVAIAGVSAPATGNVRVVSTSFGETVATNAFTYQKNAQTISFPAIGNQATTGTVGMAATASSGLSVSFAVGSGAASIANGTNLTFTGAGTVSIVASQSGDATYAPAPSVTNSFSVSLVEQTITFDAIAPQNVTNTVIPGATASSGLPVNFAVDSGPGSLTSPTSPTSLTFTNAGTVIVTASQAGNAYYASAASVTHTAKVWAVSANRGPYAGGNSVTLTNGVLGSGSDIASVTVDGTEASAISAQGVGWVRIVMPAASSEGTKDIVVTSASRGGTTLSGAYTYNPVGQITSVTPNSGSWTGGYAVVIVGVNLTDPSDLSDLSGVTLAGVTGTVQSASATQIVVTAASSPTTLAGDVVVRSAVYGAITVTNAFTYTKESQILSFPAIDGQWVTNRVGLAATASSGLPVNFAVGAGAASIANGTNLSFTGAGTVAIVAAQTGNVFYAAAPSVTNTFDVVKVPQAVDFPVIAPQPVTNRTPLQATADSGLPVTFDVKEGPGVIEVE